MSVTCDRLVVFFPGTQVFYPPINWMPRYNWNIVESGIKHHKPNPSLNIFFHNVNTCVVEKRTTMDSGGSGTHSFTGSSTHITGNFNDLIYFPRWRFTYYIVSITLLLLIFLMNSIGYIIETTCISFVYLKMKNILCNPVCKIVEIFLVMVLYTFFSGYTIFLHQ